MHACCMHTHPRHGMTGQHMSQSMERASCKHQYQGQQAASQEGTKSSAVLASSASMACPSEAAAGAVQISLQQQQRSLDSSLIKRGQKRSQPRLQARRPVSGVASPKLPPRLAASKLGRPQVGGLQTRARPGLLTGRDCCCCGCRISCGASWVLTWVPTALGPALVYLTTFPCAQRGGACSCLCGALMDCPGGAKLALGC